MWRVPSPIAPLLLAVALIPVPAAAQSLPDKKEVGEWVKKALDANILQDPDGSPYHFVAKFRHTMGDKTVDGTYEVLWAAPDRYRVEVRMGDLGETDVVLGDKKYVVRNTPTMTLAMWSASSLLFPQTSVMVPAQPRSDSVSKVYFSGEGSNRQICAIVGDHPSHTREMCFDAATLDIVSQHFGPNPHGALPKASLSSDFTGYVSLGKMRFPQHLARRVGPQLIYADVEKWEAVQTFGADTFVPPAKATEWDWCSRPEIQLKTSTQSALLPSFLAPTITASSGLEGHYLMEYKSVEADGTAKQIVELFGPQSDAAKEFLKQQRRERSALHLCGGKPVAYEIIVMFGLIPGG